MVNSVSLQRKLLPLICLLLWNVPVFAQQESDQAAIQDIFAKCRSKYDATQHFSLKTDYRLFPTYTSTVVNENYTGLTLKKGKDIYSKIENTEFAKIGSFYLKVDNWSKMMSYEQSANGEADAMVYDLNKFLANFKEFKLTSDKKSWICTMTTPAITFVPYTKVVIYVNKADYTISKQVLYMISKAPYKNKNGNMVNDYPRIEISFVDFMAKPTPGMDQKFKLDYYIKQNGKSVTASKNYKNYQIVE